MESHEQLRAAGVIKPLVEVAIGAPRRFFLLRDDGTIDHKTLSDPLRERSRDEELIRLLGYDADSRRYAMLTLLASIMGTPPRCGESAIIFQHYTWRFPAAYVVRYACLALGQLGISAAYHERIIEAGGLTSLQRSLSVDDGETIFNACYALNKLTASEQIHEVIEETSS